MSRHQPWWGGRGGLYGQVRGTALVCAGYRAGNPGSDAPRGPAARRRYDPALPCPRAAPRPPRQPMPTVHVRYFASLREALGPQEQLEVADGTTVGALRELLRARSGRHAEWLAKGRPVRAALAQAVCGDDAVLTDGAEVAFFPPVTGG